MKTFYSLLCVSFFGISSDNRNNDQKIFSISQHFRHFEEFYQKTFPVSSATAETLKQYIKDKPQNLDVHKDIWLGLWHGDPREAGLNSWIIKGYTTLDDIKKISDHVPDAISCIPELEKRLSDIDEFTKKHAQ